MVDIKEVHEFYESTKISKGRFVRSEDNPTGAFTKPKFRGELKHILSIGQIDLNMNEWDVRWSISTRNSNEEKKRESKSVCRGLEKANDGYQVTSYLVNEKHRSSINFSYIIGPYGFRYVGIICPTNLIDLVVIHQSRQVYISSSSMSE